MSLVSRISSTALLTLGACSALTGGGGDGPTVISVPDMNQRVTSVASVGGGNFVFGTDSTQSDPTHIYATDGQSLLGAVVTGDEDFASQAGTMSPNMGFGAITQIAGKTYAQLLDSTGSLAVATGDPTQASSWKVVSFGTEASGDGWGSGSQVALANSGSTWTYFSSRQIFEATAAPGSNASWTTVWAPQGSPPTPEDIEDQKNFDDPTLCDSEPYVGFAPTRVQMGYLAADRALIAYPGGGPDVLGNDGPGVCISTDSGHTFHLAPFAGAKNGPDGIACTSKDHCVAYTDVPTMPETQANYVYVTNDASKGVSSTWTAASIPAPQSDTVFTYAFFAADGMHGWLLGYDDGATALMYSTTDGGATWTDSSDLLGAHDSLRLWAGTAIDETHVIVGGETEQGTGDILYAVTMGS